MTPSSDATKLTDSKVESKSLVGNEVKSPSNELSIEKTTTESQICQKDQVENERKCEDLQKRNEKVALDDTYLTSTEGNTTAATICCTDNTITPEGNNNPNFTKPDEGTGHLSEVESPGTTESLGGTGEGTNLPSLVFRNKFKHIASAFVRLRKLGSGRATDKDAYVAGTAEGEAIGETGSPGVNESPEDGNPKVVADEGTSDPQETVKKADIDQPLPVEPLPCAEDSSTVPPPKSRNIFKRQRVSLKRESRQWSHEYDDGFV